MISRHADNRPSTVSPPSRPHLPRISPTGTALVEVASVLARLSDCMPFSGVSATALMIGASVKNSKRSRVLFDSICEHITSILRIFNDFLSENPRRVLPSLLRGRVEAFLRLLEGIEREVQNITSRRMLFAILKADEFRKRLEEQSRTLFQEHLLFLHQFYLIVNQQQRQSDAQFRIISPGFREYRLSEFCDRILHITDAPEARGIVVALNRYASQESAVKHQFLTLKVFIEIDNVEVWLRIDRVTPNPRQQLRRNLGCPTVGDLFPSDYPWLAVSRNIEIHPPVDKIRVAMKEDTLVGPSSRKLETVVLRDRDGGRSFPVVHLARALDVFSTASRQYYTLTSHNCRTMASVIQEIITVSSPLANEHPIPCHWADGIHSSNVHSTPQDLLAWRQITEQVPRGQQHGHNTSWHPEQVGQGDLDSAEVAIASEPESDPDKSDSDDSVYQTADDDNDSEREAA